MDLLKNSRVIPDVLEFIDVIKRKKKPGRVHFIELFLDDEVKDVVCERYELAEGINKNDPFYNLKREIKIHEFLGYDVFRVGVIHKDMFKMNYINAADTTSIFNQYRESREWNEEHQGPIQTMEDLENYPWPRVSDIDFGPLEWLEKNLPENMGCFDLTAHILEMITFLLGYETFCYKIADDPELIDALGEKVGRFYIDYTSTLCDFSCMPLVWGSDDMGFHTDTLASPEILREKILPWHKRCAETARKKGKLYLLHNCGNIEKIMDDFIDDVRIDARHSFEDSIMPVTEAYKKYGSRIAILGGIDVDFLCRADENAIRKRVKDTLHVCMEGAGYCLGTGNTVANYIPLENYLTMLDEGRKYKA
ncbi:MAG: uroporphyrinogen-III decarboxylase-like protein [Spirochaetes bacterium]|nr:uroporphyrinogen-III decarboxylase-like protein [Spirochaetota bacterium]